MVLQEEDNGRFARENFYAGRNINENCHKGRKINVGLSSTKRILLCKGKKVNFYMGGRAMGHSGRIGLGTPEN